MTKMMKPLDIVSKPLIYKGFRNCRTSALSFRQKASSLFHALYCAFLPTAPQDIVVCPPSGLTRYCNPLCNVPLILCLSPLCLDHILCPCHMHTPHAYSTCILHMHTPPAPTTARPCLSGTALASEWLTQRYIRRQTTPPKYRRSHKPACNKACAVLGALFSGRPLGSSTGGRCTP